MPEAVLERFIRRCADQRSSSAVVEDWGEAASWLLDAAGTSMIAVPATTAASEHPLLVLLPADRWEKLPVNKEGADFGIAIAAAGVAEVGGTVHVETALEDRIVTLMSKTLVRVVRADQVFETLDDVAGIVVPGEEAGYVAIITGASRTADIERVLTIGVQGPIDDHVLIVR